MATAHGWIKAIMWVNPLTYSIALLNHTLGLTNESPDAMVSLTVTAAIGLALLLMSGMFAAQKSMRSAA
jgi:heme/copper-type cytochrome/quinol oxidase subunit 1